jgi:Protein of unknown function (DUF559)
VNYQALQTLATAHGLISLDNATQRGISRSMWHRAVEADRLIPIHPGVARLPGAPLTVQARIEAAVLATGPGSLASHRSAALLWGAPPPADDVDEVDVIVARSRRPAELDGVVVHRPTDRADLRPVHRSGIAACNPLRVAVDLGAVASYARVEAAVETFLITGVVSMRALEATLARHARRGHEGIGALRAALDRRILGRKPSDSLLEVAFASLVTRRGLPLPVFHPTIVLDGRAYVPDFAYHGERVIIEVDGYETHGSRRAFERDRMRDAHFAAHGWLSLRFTWLNVIRRPDVVSRRLAAALAQRRAA